jgi:hypothetical protein
MYGWKLSHQMYLHFNQLYVLIDVDSGHLFWNVNE